VRRLLAMARRERRTRLFLLVYAQSSLGTGAAAVALIVLAYERYRSPWAITLVLLANYLPAGFLGPVFGAAADRFSRRTCAVVADVTRAATFVAIALVGGIEATIALAFVAGAGNALFSPSILAALPSLVRRDDLSALTSVYGSITDVGRTVGPLLAAIGFPLIGADGVMLVNGGTFAISAVVLATLPFGDAARAEAGQTPAGFLQQVREGLSATMRMPVVRVVMIASTAIILFAAMLNVAELLIARELGAGASGFAILLTAQGIGVVAGSLSGARSGGLGEYEARYLFGALAVAAGLIGLALSPAYAVAIPAFLVLGIGNGIVVVHERLIFQVTVPERLTGRAFAVLDGLGSWAFGAAYLIAAAIVALLGTRACLAIAGGGVLLVWVLTVGALRRAEAPPPQPAAQEPPVAERPGRVAEHSSER
jgi:MFS family permease